VFWSATTYYLFMFSNLPGLIESAGYIGLFFIIFAESGLFFGFFLPGDSLLFTAGFLASQGYLNVWVLTVLLVIAAISGDSFGYYFGKKIGPRLFSKPKSLLFNPEHAIRAGRFFEKYGKKSIFLARFVPVVRTFVPIVAGVGQMEYTSFIRYNVFGGLFWVILMTLGGYFLGQAIPEADKYLHYIILAIIVISVVPVVFEIWKNKKHVIR